LRAAATPNFLEHAARTLPRYTSYPTALAFEPASAETTGRWIDELTGRESLSAYVHVPFCKRLCWYCGCHTSVVHGYDRVATFHDHLLREIDLWAEALPAGRGLSGLHFGGGSPNALTREDFLVLVRRIRGRFGFEAGAELAAELDPGNLSEAFIAAIGEAGVGRVSLGVQTFEPEVQQKVNRIQPLGDVAAAVVLLRAHGVTGINFDLMYGLPAQTPENVARTARTAVSLRPDRLAVFGYAHVPWMKRHQMMIREEDLADASGRWEQAQAADEVLTGAGYVRIGLDHYALPDDELCRAAAEGRLRRNFQGYTADTAEILVPVGASSIGKLPSGFIQNEIQTHQWRSAIDECRLPIARQLPVGDEDRVRAAVIERLMCDLKADVADLRARSGFQASALDGALEAARALQVDGLCQVSGRTVRVPEAARRLVRVVAACFDSRLTTIRRRHAPAV
jgi:oxygen-independent coproporphyrinogen-3 oxidase